VTYYEELGVSPAASVEEIRESYKQLARLLHPDTLRDERSRLVAECQMKRLNSVYETLTHPERRRAYDQTIGFSAPDPLLLPEDAAERVSRWAWLVGKLRGPDGAWIGAGAIVVLMIAWTLADSSGRPLAARVIEPPEDLRPAVPAREVENRTTRGSTPVDSQVQQLRRQVEELSEERAAALAQIRSLERRLADATSKTNSIAEIPSIAPAPSRVVVPDAIPPPANWSPPAKTDLAGSWYYAVSQPLPNGRALYPPEYIEAIIREESGYLVGRYRARYRVTDRAISPEVVFQFSGKGSASAARLPWLGAGGSRGEVSLKLITQNTMEIAWIASDLGQTQGLGSGTAVLVRRHEP